jgi:alpha-mannosidase
MKKHIVLSTAVLCLLFLAALNSALGTAEEKPSSNSFDPISVSKPLYMLTYDHGGLVLWGKEHFVNHLRSAVSWLDRYDSFKIGLDNEAHTYDQLARESPEILDEIRKYLKVYSGRFGIGSCTYGQPLSVFINEESNIRQIGYALKANDLYFGCHPNIYLMSEHAMHCQIPQILKGLGFKGAIMRTHYMMYGYNPTFDASIGWWIGLDGSNITTVPTYKGQGAEFSKTTTDNWILTRYPESNAKKSLEDFRNQFSHIQPLLATRADDAGLRREELVKEYEGKAAYRWILLEELLDEFPAPATDMRTLPNDFVVRMPWGYCGNEIWNQCRVGEVNVLTAESLMTLAMMCGGPDRQRDLDQAWKDLLVAQHHDIQICGLLDDARRHLPASIDMSKNIQAASLRCLGSKMKGGGIGQITAFNPVSWTRSDWLTVTLALPRGAAKTVEVRRDGSLVPSKILSADLHSDGSLRDMRISIFTQVPGLSVASYELEAAEASSSTKNNLIKVESQALALESPYWKIQFSKKGGISSLVDQTSGREMLKPGLRSAFFAGVVNGNEVVSKGQWNLEASQPGIPWVTCRENGFIGSIPYTFQMVLREDTPRIDCSVRFTFDGQQIGRLSDNKRDSYSPFLHEEKLRFKMFPFVEEASIGVRDLPFAVSETLDQYINGIYWTALTDNRTGIAFFNRGTMGSAHEKDGSFSMPLAYAMYYIWGTRMLSGDFSYEFAIYPFSGRWRKADLHRRAVEYNYPLVGLAMQAGDGEFGYLFQPFVIKSSNVIASALFNDRGKTCLRMYEHRGKQSKLDVEYTLGKADWREVDLKGDKLDSHSNPMNWNPWQIKTLYLKELKK